jgi:hypothetical protein
MNRPEFAGGPMPPAFRNQRKPTGCDTPAPIAASSLDRPRRLPPRTDAGSPAEPRPVDQVNAVTQAVVLDPTAVAHSSSHPPQPRCCDDRLSPPNTFSLNIRSIFSGPGSSPLSARPMALPRSGRVRHPRPGQLVQQPPPPPPSRSATCLPPRPRRATMPSSRHPPWRRDSSKPAS